MWLAYMQQTNTCSIQHGRNGREYRLPELPHLKMDGCCEETRTVYEFNGCYWHGRPHCQILRDVVTIHEDTLAERYDRTMNRVGVITQAGYTVEMQLEYEFDRDILKNHPELQTLPIFQQSPLNTRDALMGVEPKLCDCTTRLRRTKRSNMWRLCVCTHGCVSTSSFL
jgi:G:T-mismatch repair DNA endonuclease (very short patch repair protein)